LFARSVRLIHLLPLFFCLEIVWKSSQNPKTKGQRKEWDKNETRSEPVALIPLFGSQLPRTKDQGSRAKDRGPNRTDPIRQQDPEESILYSLETKKKGQEKCCYMMKQAKKLI